MNEAQPTWKKIAYRTLVAIFVIGLIGSTAAIWADNRIQESDAWARTTGPLADDPTVQAFVVTEATAIIDRQIAADEDASLLQSFSRSQLSGLIQSALNDFVQSSAFVTWWTEANRTAHSIMMRTMDDEQGILLQTYGGDLVLDLQPAVDWVNGRLESLLPRIGYTIAIPPERAIIVLHSSELLENTTRVIQHVDTLKVVLPIVTLVALFGVMILARDRVDALQLLGLALAVGIVVALVLFGLWRTWFVSQQVDTRQDVLDAVFRVAMVDLMTALRVLAAAGLAVAAVVFAIRSKYASDPRAQTFLREHRELLAVGGLGIAVLALIFTDYPPMWVSVGALILILASGYLLLRWRNESAHRVSTDEHPAETL